MPVLPLNDLSSPEGRALSLFRIAAVMGSPSDLTEQGEYLVARAAKAMADVPDPAYEGLFHEKGGFGAVAEARPFSKLREIWIQRIDDWFVTSLMMNLLLRLWMGEQVVSDQASVNKAAFMLERQRNDGNADSIAAIPKNRNDILKIWGRYRPVAHLCAAVITSGNDLSVEAYRELIFVRLPLMLSAAWHYQTWGLSQTLPRTRRTILTRPDLWEIPNEVALPPIWINVTPLKESEIQLLKEYRAPVPEH